jgi:hypothetical protein
MLGWCSRSQPSSVGSANRLADTLAGFFRNALGDGHPYKHADCYAEFDADRDASCVTYSDRYTNAVANAYANADAKPDAKPDLYANADANSDAYAIADTSWQRNILILADVAAKSDNEREHSDYRE